MLIYATPEDVRDWAGKDVENAERYARSASLMVTRATVGAVYPTTPTGRPTDPAVTAALNAAVCAQVTFWDATGIDPAAGAVQAAEAVLTGKSLAGASFTYSTSAASVTTAEARNTAAVTLCDETVTILRTAGLLTTTVWAG